MIFKKILKGTDLTFGISLEKTHYTPGEEVRGTLTINTEKGAKARKLVLLVEGKESTAITVRESNDIGSRQDRDSKTYSETNVFFSKDLSGLLRQSVITNILQDGTLEILPQNKVMAFDFTLPDDDTLFSSYRGKHAIITYIVKGTVDIANKLDENREEGFSIVNPNNRTVRYSSSDTPFYGENKSDVISPNNIDAPENMVPSPVTESEQEGSEKGRYEARFEQIFGKNANHNRFKNSPRYFRSTRTGISFDLETIFAKGREDFLKESSETKINLIDQSNSIASYTPGGTIRGNIIPRLLHNEEEEIKKKLRGMKVTLTGMEHAFAQGLQRVSTIEKYEKKIDLDGNHIRGKNDNNNLISFEFEIPHGVNQSYVGKYSEYFWGLEAKINIAWSSDLIAKTLIEII
jgi:hypothetical protein